MALDGGPDRPTRRAARRRSATGVRIRARKLHEDVPAKSVGKQVGAGGVLGQVRLLLQNHALEALLEPSGLIPQRILLADLAICANESRRSRQNAKSFTLISKKGQPPANGGSSSTVSPGRSTTVAGSDVPVGRSPTSTEHTDTTSLSRGRSAWRATTSPSSSESVRGPGTISLSTPAAARAPRPVPDEDPVFHCVVPGSSSNHGGILPHRFDPRRGVGTGRRRSGPLHAVLGQRSAANSRARSQVTADLLFLPAWRGARAASGFEQRQPGDCDRPWSTKAAAVCAQCTDFPKVHPRVHLPRVGRPHYFQRTTKRRPTEYRRVWLGPAPGANQCRAICRAGFDRARRHPDGFA